jgi:hypothetical protein
MRRTSLVLLLLLTLAGCGDADSSEVARNSDVPGTRPSTAAPSPTDTPTSVEESLTPSSSPSPSEPVSTEIVDVSPEALAGYRALATGLASLFRKAQRIEKNHPDANPQTTDEINELIGDVYPDGVALVVFDEGGVICLTGPGRTAVVLGEHGDGIRQAFRTGDCDGASVGEELADGDIVVDIAFGLVGEDDSGVRYRSRVMKGQNLADQIPDFGAFLDVLNRAVAG